MSPHLFLAFFIISVLQSCIGQSVKQTEGVVTVIQGDQILINCSYELSSPYQPNLFWYVQHPGLPPKFFLSHLGNISMQLHQGFQAKHDKKQKTFNLKKSVSQLSDSAFYICAVSLLTSSSYRIHLAKGTQLIVKPVLENSEPSIYQLKQINKETTVDAGNQEDIAACLFTDYFPNPLNVGINKMSREPANGSVVVVKEHDTDKGTPSYGIVLWGTDDEKFTCSASYNDIDLTTNLNDLGICSEEDENSTFVTDERLNLLSLSVLGLRIIFFKSIVFNVLLTFHVYSRRVQK